MAKPHYKRALRVADQIRMEIADILTRKIKDPRLGLLTVTHVEVSNDLRVARIYVTTLQDGESGQEVFKGLHSAMGFIRTELGRRLPLRYTPDLMFFPDSNGPKEERMYHLLETLHGERDANTGSEPQAQC